MMLADGGETLRETATWKTEEMGGVIMISIREMNFQAGKYLRIMFNGRHLY
jgi:hypothetical protein